MPDKPDPWQFFSAEAIATASGCPLANVQENHPRIVEQLDHAGINDEYVQIGAIGTIGIETAHQYAPVREAFWLSEEWRQANLTRYYPYYGRGFIQRTWRDGYAEAGPAVAKLWGASADDPTFDLVKNPDNLLDPNMAAADFACYFRDNGVANAARSAVWFDVRHLVYGGDDPEGTDYIRAVAARLQGQGDRLYGPDVPDELVRQQNDWSCAVRSTYAALWAMNQLGQGPAVSYGDSGPNDVYDLLVPLYDDPTTGLHFADGHELAAALQSRGYRATVSYPVTLTDVQAVAGLKPVLLGGSGWNHWVYCRGLEADGTLVLENPSPGYDGVNTELRDSFTKLGPFAMIAIDGHADPQPLPQPLPQPQPQPVPDELAALRAEVERLRTVLGYSTHDLADAIAKEIGTIEARLAVLNGGLVSMQASVAEARASLDALRAAQESLKRQMEG